MLPHRAGTAKRIEFVSLQDMKGSGEPREYDKLRHLTELN